MVPGKRIFDLPVRIADSGWAKKIVVADFTGDGKKDFAFLEWETGGRGVGRLVGKGFLVQTFINTTPPGTAPATFRPGDVLKFLNDDFRVFPMFPNDIATGDFLGRGLDDIAVANSHSDQIFLYLSNGDGTFADPVLIGSTGDNDCAYLATGDFNGDGKLDIAVLHTYRLPAALPPGTDFQWTLSFLFGNGDGTFQPAIKHTQGNYGFSNYANDGGAYYESTTFNFETMSKSILVGGVPRDAVSAGGVTVWWDGDIKASAFVPTAFYHDISNETGRYVMHHYNPPRADRADVGGMEIRSSNSTPADNLVDKADVTVLDKVFPDLRQDYRGTHVICEDFDGDGTLDLLIFSDRASDGSNAEGDFAVIYGVNDLTNPLTVKSGTEWNRFRFFPNGAGGWHLGHRAWRAAVADFDGDGYLDIITITTGDVLLHMNLGQRAYQGLPPVIQQISLVTPHAMGSPSTPWYGDQLRITFTKTDARPIYAAIFHPVGAPAEGIAVKMYTNPATAGSEGTITLPDESVLPPGKYTVTIFNGAVESSNSVPEEIVIRPLAIDSVTFTGVGRGQDSMLFEVKGYFGLNAELPVSNFTIQNKAMPGPPLQLLYQQLGETRMVEKVPVSAAPGTWVLKYSNPSRGIVQHDFVVPSVAPQFKTLAWTNPDNTTGQLTIAKGATGSALQAGGKVTYQGSNLFIKQPSSWHLRDSTGKLILTGAGTAGRGDNGTGEYVFTVPATIPEASGYQFTVSTDLGLTATPPAITSIAKAKPADTSDYIYVGVENLDNGEVGVCVVEGFVAAKYDDPKGTPPGALQQAKAIYSDGHTYEFTEVDQDDALTPGGLCSTREWEFEGTNMLDIPVSDTVTAISEKRARVNAISHYGLKSIESIKRKDA